MKKLQEALKTESSLSRLIRLVEAFKYTGDVNKYFNDEHPLIIDMVIEQAVNHRKDVPHEKRKEVEKILMDKFASVYKHNHRVADSILNGRGNSGRDTLYSFLNHWIDSLVKTNFVPGKFFKGSDV